MPYSSSPSVNTRNSLPTSSTRAACVCGLAAIKGSPSIQYGVGLRPFLAIGPRQREHIHNQRHAAVTQDGGCRYPRHCAGVRVQSLNLDLMLDHMFCQTLRQATVLL